MTVVGPTIELPGRRPSWARAFDAFLTGLMWLAYLYLVREAFGDVALLVGEWFRWAFDAAAWPSVPEVGRFLRTVRIYGAVVLANAALLVAWALYNQLRFRGRPKAAVPRPVSSAELAALYRVPVADVARWQAARRMVIAHDSEGTILSVSVGEAGGLPPTGQRAVPVPA